MNKINKNIYKFILLFLTIIVPCREIIALYTNSYIKFIPDLLIWGSLLFFIAKNKFKVTLKIYDCFFIGFILIGFISCLINSVSLVGFALQVRSIGTMYALFYLLRNISLDKEDYSQIINNLVIINIIFILVAILEILSYKTLFFPREWADAIIYENNFGRAYSLMNNPNTFGMFTFMVMTLFYNKNECCIEKKHIAYYFLALVGILLTASRSVLIVVVIFYLYILIKAIYNKFFYNITIMIVIFILSFISIFGIEQIQKNNELYSFINDIILKEKDNKTHSESSLKDKNDTTNKEQEIESNNTPIIITPNTNNNTNIIDRLQETASGKTAEDSKFNGRLYIIDTGLKVFVEHPIIGTGFATFGSSGSRMVTPAIYDQYNLPTDFYSDNEYIKIIVETGILGTLVFAVFCLALLWENFKKRNIHSILILLEFLLMGMFYNIFELQILCMLLYFSLVFYDNKSSLKEIDNKKVSILALHLGTGGVEQVVVNTANMLCDTYEVEIISLYNHNKQLPFELNKKVKINYLMNTISNREELKIAIKSKNILSIVKEGFKALYILANKNRLMIKAIDSTNASVIISTRYSFSKLLNDFGNTNQYKIHQEHTYSVSDEYIKKLNKLKKINCIMPASQTIYEKYDKKINAKLIYIPFVLNYYPEDSETSKLNTKNLIAVGRLEKEKGFDDLLNIISKLNDKEIFLNLFGDGSLMKQLKNQAKELGIENQVKFWGFKKQNFIKEYMLESSLYVMTSHEESFGLVLIEAMSYGIPCIAYDSAEGAKFTINKDNGYFIKNRNESEMLKTIKSYLKLPQKEKIRMGKAAKKTIEAYEYDTIKKKWLSFIQDVMEVK